VQVGSLSHVSMLGEDAVAVGKAVNFIFLPPVGALPMEE
jgi:hypothetical protein